MTAVKGLSAGVVKMLRQAAKRKEPPQAKAPKVKPTPEQMKRGHFKNVAGIEGSKYQREPLFETLAKGKSGIDADGLRALRFYREQYEASAQSLTKCALDVQGGGGAGGVPAFPRGVDSGQMVGDGQWYTPLQRCDEAMGAVADTMRAVALEDQSFSDVAIARFGSRQQSWIEQEKERGKTKKGGKMAYVEKVVPRSGRHREIVRSEFLLALERLTKAVQPYVSTAR